MEHIIMEVEIHESKKELGKKSANQAAKKIKHALRKSGSARIILATGASQFETLKNLVETPGIEWSQVEMFHLDEYAGMKETHPASFRKYLKERFVRKVPDLQAAHFIKGDADNLEAECRRLGELIKEKPVDVALVGIGENGHLAFNDPPADFETDEPYIVVDLDEACRKQQLGEGWFDSIEDVPNQAISMSIRQIMKSKSIVCSVPDKRKAQAVKDCLSGEVSNLHPASVLQNHEECTIHLDKDSASLLNHD
jgi:glucosamine-6-phosphate deaminase